MNNEHEINSEAPDLVVESIDSNDVYARLNKTGKYARADRDEAARRAVEHDVEEVS